MANNTQSQQIVNLSLSPLFIEPTYHCHQLLEFHQPVAVHRRFDAARQSSSGWLCQYPVNIIMTMTRPSQQNLPACCCSLISARGKQLFRSKQNATRASKPRENNTPPSHSFIQYTLWDSMEILYCDAKNLKSQPQYFIWVILIIREITSQFF